MMATLEMPKKSEERVLRPLGNAAPEKAEVHAEVRLQQAAKRKAPAAKVVVAKIPEERGVVLEGAGVEA